MNKTEGTVQKPMRVRSLSPDGSMLFLEASATRQEQFKLAEGDAVLSLPSDLSADSLDDLAARLKSFIDALRAN